MFSNPLMRHATAKLIVLSASLAAFIGCQHTYKEVPLGSQSPRPRLSGDAIVYVPIPPDALFKKTVAADSGKLTAIALREAFAKYVKRAYVGRRMESKSESLETARQHQCTYVVYSQVLRWEDRATEFSGRTDKIEIKIEVADAVSGETLHATVLQGKSRWFTDGGDKPQDLLQEPIANYVASLFQTVQGPSASK